MKPAGESRPDEDVDNIDDDDGFDDNIDYDCWLMMMMV